MRVELHQEYVPLGERVALFNEIPAGRTQDKSLSPQRNKRPLMKILSKLRERGLMRLQFEIEAFTQDGCEPQHQNCLPSEFGWGAFPLRTHVGGNDSSPTSPFTELFDG